MIFLNKLLIPCYHDFRKEIKSRISFPITDTAWKFYFMILGLLSDSGLSHLPLPHISCYRFVLLPVPHGVGLPGLFNGLAMYLFTAGLTAVGLSTAD